MRERNESALALPATSSRMYWRAFLRQGAQRMLSEAIEAEVAEWIETHRELRDAAGRRQVVRNGRMPKRTILTGVGPIEVEQLRVLDRRPKDEAEPFSSKILPPVFASGSDGPVLPATGGADLRRCRAGAAAGQ